ncbi:TPA: hypothetical protein SMR42_002205 [Pseudomonas putida]|nr:hypothetical protein [Pseudomonas putida]
MGMTTDSAPELQRDFTATIYWMNGNKLVPIRRSSARDKFTWGIAPEGNWLQAGGDQPSLPLDFEFHSKTEDRLHYMISMSSGNKLGRSVNGYLGLYQISEVTDYWKLEPLRRASNGWVCHFRDHEGHGVKTWLDNPHFDNSTYHFLNTYEGNDAEFLVVPTT